MLSAHEGGIDLCLIPTGIHWHARMTIAALRAGANVLVIEGEGGEARWRYERDTSWQDSTGARDARQLHDANGARRCMMADILRHLSDPGAPNCTTEMAAAHTRFIESLHRDCPVIPFDPEKVLWTGDDGATSAIPNVPGLERALRDVFKAKAMVVESSFASVQRGRWGCRNAAVPTVEVQAA